MSHICTTPTNFLVGRFRLEKMDRQDSRQPKLEFEGMKRVRYSRYTQTRRVPILSIQLLAPCFSPSAFLPHDLVLLLPRPLLLSIALTISEHTTLFDQFSSPWASKDMSEQVLNAHLQVHWWRLLMVLLVEKNLTLYSVIVMMVLFSVFLNLTL
ncbi:hypothetical protein I3842_01G027600 [Carya illinoinensis]|uniref:Uncharacterized protein n=1 Tax=Carya illinoinensis TaxID=32201 RepID=A0A922G0V3_CARIL|nr:hypothetical protein I3842_01G027600 [Carya illinoinensis]